MARAKLPLAQLTAVGSPELRRASSVRSMKSVAGSAWGAVRLRKYFWFENPP